MATLLETGSLVEVQLGVTVSVGTFVVGIQISKTRSAPQPMPEHYEQVKRLLAILETGRQDA